MLLVPPALPHHHVEHNFVLDEELRSKAQMGDWGYLFEESGSDSSQASATGDFEQFGPPPPDSSPIRLDENDHR